MENGMDVSELRLLGTRLLVEPLQVPEYRDGSFVVPSTVGSTIPPQQGKVILIGPDVTKTSAGNTIVWGTGVGSSFFVSDTCYLFLNEKDIVCGIK